MVASCATPQKEKQDNKVETLYVEPKVIVKEKYTAGSVVTNPYPIPDSSIIPDVKPLTDEFIQEDDIDVDSVMDTTIAWSRQYHDLATTYNVLRGWVIGVRAGQSLETKPIEE